MAVGAFSTPAAAHSGTTHAGTPHWLLFVLLIVGIGGIAGSVASARRGIVSFRAAAVILAGGVVSVAFSGIGLVELQVVGTTPPKLVDIYLPLSLVASTLLAVGGFATVRLKRPTKPLYAVLCVILGSWIAYPVVMPNQGYTNPLGYLLALSLPAVLAAIVWSDARGIIQSIRLQTKPKLFGIAAGLLMSVFFAFSGGTMSFNPDDGANVPTEAFVIPYEVASPLVVWPAVEWYFPSIPFTGYISVGTVLVMGVLGSLVGLNVAVVTQQWTNSGSVAGKKMLSGSLATSGATACCCCAPAFYGVLSVLFGTAATPIYWSS
ncbi:hypothetical protein NDI76_22125 [Halogeometricum sp. S1BR25-6]|uniref:Uncharacterized protein n=1 Tax=Halogeometricum salsisoli TaxID=2950536 RepID=A0ABU2GKW4_9EURY|nr:hypothetical protein [Halogeometricum sp. S1BR25-6]MDS0301430.1 hypothetical protein [Halogeometricum sp. S1BR25-6]